MKTKLIISLVLFQIILGNNILFGQKKINHVLKERIDTYLNNSLANGYYGSVFIAQKGDIIISKGYGWSDREHKILNAPTSVFNIGSVTKQFTAAAILKLVEEGKLNTSDNLGKFYNIIPSDKKNITIHQLLTHTSGISPATGGFRYNEATKEQFLEDFFTAKLQSAPGTQHQYANANYILLAAIIESVSGEAYSTFLREKFWKPLGMNHTGYKSISFNNEMISHGYYFNYTDGVWKDWGITQDHLPHSDNHWYSIGKGDLYSTTLDLYKWHVALETNKVLNANSKKLLETPFVAENQDENTYYAYGWSTFKTKTGGKVVWHNGSNGIYFANFLRFVDDDIVVIVLSNTILNNDSENVAWEISKLILDSNYTPKPVTKLSYELVYDFINTNKPNKSKELITFLEENLNSKFSDKAVFNRIGFKLLKKEKEPNWGLELLKLNVQLFPKDGNLWDSLGDGYLIYNLNESAIYSFEMALKLKPDSGGCHWCENSKNKLKVLNYK